MFRAMSKTTRYWLIAAGVILVALYLHGTFDRALAPLGLNRHSCIETAFGAIKCGEAKVELEAEMEAAENALEREYRKEHPTAAEEWTPPSPQERQEDERQRRQDCELLRSIGTSDPVICGP